VTELSVWAPSADSVSVETGQQRHAMSSGGGGWWRIDIPSLVHGDDYAFLLDDATTALPDPRSRWQPDGVHGPSRVYDQARFAWTDGAWRGVVLPGAVFYELHIGTFTPEGTLDAALGRLDHLVDLGVDFVELMPVAAFPGVHGWGYDGVHLFAVHEPYGGPDALKRLVDACHQRGLGVALDVVYNHLGPSGNYLPSFGPYFTENHHTPWGAAVNLDDEGNHEVRRWIIDNALMWLRDFHLDALRLDAIHAFVDDSEVHLLSALSREVDVLATQLHRPLSLVAESDLNQPVLVLPRECGGIGMTAQWSDDLHHALHALLTGEADGYYADFAADAFGAVTATLTSAFFHAGTWSTFREAVHGAPVDTATTPGYRFLGYLQDHDQVGNRASGDRITATISLGRAKVGAALVFTSPFTPMLFMGEEWAASTPWQFFTDHQEPELAEAVRTGRRSEFAEHGWSESDVPDPQDPATVERSRLDWSELDRAPHAEMLEWHRLLIALRRSEPSLRDPRLDEVSVVADAAQGWVVVRRRGLQVVANLAAEPRTISLGTPVAEVVLTSADVTVGESSITLPSESVAVVRVAG
jgi:maltooligosyltrehalose trehalohydrolase